MLSRFKEKITTLFSDASGIASILGSYNICHSTCLIIISILAFFGIMISGMPLAFLQDYRIPLWTIALILFVIALLIYLKKQCISKNLIIFNTGIIVFGTPFPLFPSLFYYIAGGIIILISLILYLKRKL